MGTTADCCVSATVREANDRGYDCLVLTDCVADVSDSPHRIDPGVLPHQPAGSNRRAVSLPDCTSIAAAASGGSYQSAVQFGHQQAQFVGAAVEVVLVSGTGIDDLLPRLGLQRVQLESPDPRADRSLSRPPPPCGGARSRARRRSDPVIGAASGRLRRIQRRCSGSITTTRSASAASVTAELPRPVGMVDEPVAGQRRPGAGSHGMALQREDARAAHVDPVVGVEVPQHGRGHGRPGRVAGAHHVHHRPLPHRRHPSPAASGTRACGCPWGL